MKYSAFHSLSIASLSSTYQSLFRISTSPLLPTYAFLEVVSDVRPRPLYVFARRRNLRLGVWKSARVRRFYMICLAKGALMGPGGTIEVGHQFDRRDPSCHTASSSVRQCVSRVVRMDASREQRKERSRHSRFSNLSCRHRSLVTHQALLCRSVSFSCVISAKACHFPAF